MAKLIVYCNEQRTEYELAAVNEIGRHHENTIQILDHLVSKKHAHIIRKPGGAYVLRDLQSRNGSFVRGERVSEQQLHNGDDIRIGSARIVFVQTDSEEPDLTRVTIVPDVDEDQIRRRITADSGEFAPEQDIRDEQVLRGDYERLRIGHELAQTVGTELNLEKLFPKILDKAFDLVAADRGVLMLMDASGELIPACARTRNGRAEGDTIILSKTVTAEVIQNKAAVLSSDATHDERFSDARSIIMQGIRSTMTVPLLHADEILGIMHLDSQSVTSAFTEKELRICTTVASQAAVAIQNARLARHIEREAATRAQISRLIPPSVVDQVIKGDLVIEKGGRLSEITMLYSDIRGFTAMSDGAPPAEVVDTLNDYFEVMVEVLFRHNGTLDKFVGDEIIGLFGAPIAMEDHEYKAVCCAIDMLRSLEVFNRIREAENRPPIRIGIGINTGSVITGSIGSTMALQYTAIGDAMNVASRLVGIAKADEIIISELTYSRIAERIEAQPLAPVRVKGKADEMQTYRVLGYRSSESSHSSQSKM
jgi:adenylate cyclase